MYTTNSPVPGTTLEEKEKKILEKCPYLALKGFSISEYDDCIEDFIYNFLVHYNRKYTTHKVTITADSAIHTTVTRHRSLIDIFMITKYYFPEATLKDVIKALWKDPENLCRRVCSTINRRVYQRRERYTLANWSNSHADYRDELNYTEKELLNIANS